MVRLRDDALLQARSLKGTFQFHFMVRLEDAGTWKLLVDGGKFQFHYGTIRGTSKSLGTLVTKFQFTMVRLEFNRTT